MIFTGLLAAVGALATWHIYEVTTVFAATGLTTVVGMLLAWLLRRVRWWWRVLVIAVTYLAVTAVLTLPELIGDPAAAPSHALRILMAPVAGWKDLLTLDLPLGNYQAVIAPYVLVVLCATYGAIALSWRAGRAGGFAPVVALVMPIFGLLFGTSAVNLREQMLTGALGFGIALTWLIWRASSVRRRALRIAEGSTDFRSSGNRSASVVRALSGAVIIALALTLGLFLTPQVLAGQTRDVPRAAVQPEIELDRTVSPLSTFRAYRSADLIDTTLFTVTAPQSVERIRFATLGSYDGVTMRPGPGAEEGAPQFRRVPSVIHRDANDTAQVVVTLEGYTDLWVPLPDNLISASFEGASRSALNDNFFYEAASETGIQLSSAGFSEGDRIVTIAAPDLASTVSEFQPLRSGGSVPEHLVPQSLTTWLSAQQVNLGGQGLVSLIDTLRARGFLSHSIVEDESAAAWMDAFGVVSFEPSRAGHMTARIDRMFADLNSRALEVADASNDEALVAAVGDDEQFAVAAFLIADALGFEARVAMGVTLTSADAGGVPACALGVCRGENVTAWLEVRDAATGVWGAIDVTPQTEIPPQAETTRTSEPQHVTEVESQHADFVPPPEATPNEGGTPPEDIDETTSLWAQLWPILRWVFIGLLAFLLLAVPFLVIMGVKLLNSRARRRARSERQRVVGGWDELVDRAVDYGAPFPRHETRLEYAELLGREGIADLAAFADSAAFSASPVSNDDAEHYWSLVHAAHVEMRHERGWWGHIRSRISPRSLRAAVQREMRAESWRL